MLKVIHLCLNVLLIWQLEAGAIIEKHFTYKRELKWYDYHSSLSEENLLILQKF